jgi:hypothetical protein
MKELAVLSVLLIFSFCPLIQAQDVTVRADSTPDDSISQTYMALDRDCRALVNKRGDATETIAACKKVADQADKFAPQSHFITRRAAYVFYTTALIQANKPEEAVVVGNKAVAIVLLGHDDASGSSAAYNVRGQAKAIAGDLTGADQDLEKAEAYQRDGLNSPAGKELNAEYTRVLKGLLTFHAQVLIAMGKQGAAGIKLDQANKLSIN